MPGPNEILVWAPNGTAGAGDVLADQAAYAASTTRLNGHQPGDALREQENHVLRQITRMLNAIAQSVANHSPAGVVDDGNQANAIASFEAGILALVAAGLIGYKKVTAAGPQNCTGAYANFASGAITKRNGATSVLVVIGKAIATISNAGLGGASASAVIAVDGTPIADSESQAGSNLSNQGGFAGVTACPFAVVTGLASGAHTVGLQVKTTPGSTQTPVMTLGSLLVVEINNPFAL